jgi:hypothetical protein
MSSPLAVSLSQYNTARSDFQQRYYLESCDTLFSGQDLRLSWASFSAAITAFITVNSLDAANIALRFVYCYDASSKALYLRMQIMTMTADAVRPGIYNLNTTPCVWYELTDHSIVGTTNSNLYDQPYLDNFYYCNANICSELRLQNLATDILAEKYARMVTFPWSMELLQMYLDNDSPSDATICFAASSFASSTACAFPHTLVIYLRNSDNVSLMDNNAATGFEMKGADCGTICPDGCGICQSVS